MRLWNLKTASDPLAGYIKPIPQEVTIPQLVSLRRPPRRGGARTAGAETTVWRLRNVALVNMKYESDGDFHLVIGDGRYSMIAEAPAQRCLGNGPLTKQIAEARSIFEQDFRSGDRIISIEGVGFFDQEHGQTGAAFNQIELHPVTAICFGQDCELHPSARAFDGAPTEEQVKEKEWEADLASGGKALCASRANARDYMQLFRRFLDACRSSGFFDQEHSCTEEAAKALDLTVREAIVDTNAREDEFLEKWGSEAFLALTCAPD